jgi:hypothetical protein
MGRIQTSWEIAKRSWAVLRSDKSLAWFPVFSFLGSLAVVAGIGGLIALTGIDDSSTGNSLQPIGYVFIVIGYLLLAFVQTYFLAALVAGADTRLTGADSTVSGALQVANSRLHRLMPCGGVGHRVDHPQHARALRHRRADHRRARRPRGTSSPSTVPILVIEDIAIGPAFKRSKDLFKQTWVRTSSARPGSACSRSW